MSTNSAIGIVERFSGGDVTSVRGIYCHWDGYLEHVGSLLVKHYDTADKLRPLLALGDISVLRKSVGEKHGFEDRHEADVNGWTTAYGRDRGESGVRANTFNAVSEFCSHYVPCGAEYLYLLDRGRWIYQAVGDDSFIQTNEACWRPLEPRIRSIELRSHCDAIDSLIDGNTSDDLGGLLAPVLESMKCAAKTLEEVCNVA